jgi:hypothetical protein
MEILLLPAYLLKTLGFVAKKLCSGWLDDAWSNPPNFEFQVSSKYDTSPALHGNATNLLEECNSIIFIFILMLVSVGWLLLELVVVISI